MSYEDFKRVFQGHDDELESRAIGGMEGSSNFVTIAPKPIPEMSDLLNQVCRNAFACAVCLVRSVWLLVVSTAHVL